MIPKLQLGVDARFEALVGRPILNAGWGGWQISDARQIIRFRLDETGALLESEAAVIGDNESSSGPPPGQRKFIFNRHFLIYLIECDASQPYFAAWIENAELMERRE